MTYFYEIKIKRKKFFYHYIKRLNTLEEVKTYISDMTEEDIILTITKFHIIYKHIENMPGFDYHDNFSGWDCFNKKHKLKNEYLKTISIKDYKKNIIKENTNYMIQYNIITEHHNDNNLLIKSTSCYCVNDLKEIKKQLYTLSKSTQVFNIVFYQYESLSLSDI